MNTNINNNRAKIIQAFLHFIILAGCKRVEPPENVKVNPNPSEKYLVTIQFDDVAAIRDVEAIKRYSVTNTKTCSPIDNNAIGGRWNDIRKSATMKLPPVAHNKFQTIYYPKMFLDESYYLMEICRWNGYGIDYRFIKNSVLYLFILDEIDIVQAKKVSIQCESLKKNRTDGIPQICKSHEPFELAMIDSYFEIIINSMELK